MEVGQVDERKKYNIGLDIGTSSVGWAVVESGTQKIIKKGKNASRKSLWGVRLFDPASTAFERRSFRSTRRRYDRRRNRIKLLQKEFVEEMNKVDSNFFKKLAQSKYCEKDKVNKSILLSADEKNQVKEYNNKYKTIYHLRNRLITDSSKEDIRLVYLALHHMIKYRGNFLYSGDNFTINNLDLGEKIKNVFESFMNSIPSLGIRDDYLDMIQVDELEKIVLNPSKNDVKVGIKETLNHITDNKKFSDEFGKVVVGNKFSIKKLFMLEDLEKDITISFDGTDYEDKYNELEELLADKIEALQVLKELYDTLFLKKLFKGSTHTSLSALMTERYTVHERDLRFLKQLFAKERKLYNQLFRNTKDFCLYEQYIHNKISYEEFSKELKKLIDKVLNYEVDHLLAEKWTKDAQQRVENGEFLPRITDPENGKYPYQLNKEELIKIIENQGQYYPFLLEKIENKYKIVKLLEFRIPYYVGPLNHTTNRKGKNSDFAWMERKINHVSITPYNFDEVVDKEATAEKFIKKMISHCTYLLNEYALPNSSILYSKYKVMNELKQIKINGEKIKKAMQNKIIENLFMKTSGSITDKKFKEYLYSLNDLDMYDGNINITGYSADGKFANHMQSYVDFFGENGIFTNTSYKEEDADEIIEWITIFDDKDILEKKVRNKYSKLSDKQVQSILSKKYRGWGNLSKKLLTGLFVEDKNTKIPKNIMTLLAETEENFIQIINNDKYKFQDLIKENNVVKECKKINYDLVRELATSPATKKGIYQSLKVIEEIVDYMGYEPENIMIEMARGEDSKKGRKEDKKNYLLNIYKKIKEEYPHSYFNYDAVYSELSNLEKIDSQKLFLYFIQEGKCLYTGKPFNLEDLDYYEVDHIIPRTLIKDDSIDHKSLVCRECNQIKADSFVLPVEYRKNMKKWWEHLKSIGLISAKKFYRLTRDSYKDEDIQGFINRQLVETRQITKHVANIISNFYKKTNVVYLKANLSHHYREKYELFKFREINDYHHAHDAYLAVVLGEYKEKYMKKNINFEMVKEMNSKLRSLGNNKQLKYGFVINSLDENVNDIVLEMCKDRTDEKTGELLFDAREFNRKVENTLYRSDILVSRKTEIKDGLLFKEKMYPKKVGNIKIKENMPTHLYGGYSNMQTAYFVLVKYHEKLKLIGIPVDISLKARKDSAVKYNFIKEHLNGDAFEILKDKIPFEALIDYKGQKVYIKGYSVANKNCEISNANQLKIPKEKIKHWKYVLNKVLNQVDIPKKEGIPILNDAMMTTILLEIITYLYEQKEKYPLFVNEINRIEEKIALKELNNADLMKIINQLFIIYHCNSINGNLKEFGLKDRIGRLSGKNIESGIIISRSITGMKESAYEF